MSLFKTLRRMTGLEKQSTPVGQDRNDHPLDMHPGSLVTIPEIDLVLAESEGSILPKITGNQTVTAMGQYQLFGLDVFHSYLSQDGAFIRTVAKGDKVMECAIFVRRDRIEPQSEEDWAFWLGHYHDGDFAEAGLIGWPQFQVDDPEKIIYDRSWNPSVSGIKPITFMETVTHKSELREMVNHEAMEYSRRLSTDIVETIFVTLAHSGNQASVDIYVGIPLNVNNLKVLAV